MNKGDIIKITNGDIEMEATVKAYEVIYKREGFVPLEEADTDPDETNPDETNPDEAAETTEEAEKVEEEKPKAKAKTTAKKRG